MAVFSKPFLVVALVLLLRSRLISLPLKKLSTARLSQKQLADVLQQVYVKNEDGSKTLLIPYRDRVSKVGCKIPTLIHLLIKYQVIIRPTPTSKFASDAPFFPPLPAHSKPNIDAAFLSQLRAILFRIAFPKFRSKESFIVVLHSFFLVLRTVLSVAVAKLDGRIARDLVYDACVIFQCLADALL
jgi:ATP-binding cassette, subfamily D (ALD), peroxisomal long-chain fatty acid import protein